MANGAGQNHKVKAGETLHDIALKYHMATGTIWFHGRNKMFRQAHNNSRALKEGSDLWIPGEGQNQGGARSGQQVRVARETPRGILGIKVVNGAGNPVARAAVQILANGWACLTGEDGTIDFGKVEPATYAVSVEKPGYGTAAGQPAGVVRKNVTVTANQSVSETVTLISVETVTKIEAVIPGTKGKRDPTQALPDNVLTASTDNRDSLTDNVPVVLVRGCTEVKLSATTTPAGKPVLWRIISNPAGKYTPPQITPDAAGPKATLKTNNQGSFSVIAELGDSKIVWNVVFVWVKVLVMTSNIQSQSDKFEDNGSDADWTQFRSGKFEASFWAWQATVDVKLFGGGADEKLGVDKVGMRILQNCFVDSLAGNYDHPGHRAVETPNGGVPIVDASPGSNFIDEAYGCIEITPDNVSDTRKIWTGDSPCGSFPRYHQPSLPANSYKLLSVDGVNDFTTLVASVSDHAPNAVVVHAKTNWVADYDGTVDYGRPAGATGKYKRQSAKITAQARYQQISWQTGGQDANAAGFEVVLPRFVDGLTNTWKP
jgi:hypothetical protein